MENGSKRKLFSLKNLIILLVIVFLLFLIIYFVFFTGKQKNKTLKCNIPYIFKTEFLTMDLVANVYYTKNIDRLEEVMTFNLISNYEESKIDDLEKSLKKIYENMNKSESIDINVSRNNHIITIIIDIDYKTVKLEDLEFFNLFGRAIEYKFANGMTIDQFKKSVEEAGGACE